MEEQNSQVGPISTGAVVEATDGLIGTVVSVIYMPETKKIMHLIVDNDNGDKQFTIPANLIAGQVGTQVVHLNVSREEFLKSGVDMEVDTSAGTFGHPTPPLSQ